MNEQVSVCVCVLSFSHCSIYRWGGSLFFCFTKLGPRSSLDRNKKMLDNLCVGFGLIKIYRLLRADTHTHRAALLCSLFREVSLSYSFFLFAYLLHFFY